MAMNFQIVPPSGPVSGASFEDQVERAINELGAQIESADVDLSEIRAIAEDARDTAYEALDTSQTAVTVANSATQAASAAQNTANSATQAAAAAQNTANNATQAAAAAQNTANSANAKAETAQTAADAADAKADAAGAKADAAQTTANNAEAAASSAQVVAASAQTTAVKALGTYTVNTGIQNANTYFNAPDKLYLTNPQCTNFPCPVPLYFTVFINSERNSVTQFVWPKTATGVVYQRTGTVANGAATWGAWIESGGGAVKIDLNDKVISESTDGLLASVSLKLDTATGVLSLFGKNDSTGKPFLISTVNFPLQELLTDAKTVVNPTGQPAGTYIQLTFSTSAGPRNVFINVSLLVDVYTAGNAAIAISADKKVSLVVNPNSHLAVSSSGLGLETGYVLMTEAERTKLAGVSGGKILATANVTLYVRMNGNDLNAGTTDTDAGALKTWAGVVKRALDYDFNGFTLTISYATGIYEPIETTNFIASNAQAVIITSTTKTSSGVYASIGAIGSGRQFCIAITGQRVPIIYLQYLNCTVTSAVPSGIYVTQGAIVSCAFVNIQSDGRTNSMTYGILAESLAYVEINTEVYIGGADQVGCAVAVKINAVVRQRSTLTVHATTYTTAVIGVTGVSTYEAAANPICNLNGPSAWITGKRFVVTTNGVLNTNGAGPNAFPGSADGTTTTGGQYA